MRSDILRAAIESELDDHKQKLIRLRGKLQKAVDDLDVSRSKMLATMLGCYKIVVALWWLVHGSKPKMFHDSWGCMYVMMFGYIVWLPCAKVGAMPALVKTADSEEADFRDFLTRVNLKWRDHGNTGKSWQFLWCGTCCVAWLLFSKSEGSEVLDQGSLQGKTHVQVMKSFYRVCLANSKYNTWKQIDTNERNWFW